MKRSTLAQILLIVIVLLGVIFVGDSVTQSRLLSHNRTVVVELASAGGLHDRSGVSYRGNRIGIVSDVRLHGAGVEAVLKLDSDARVPVDTEVVVANLSPIGEQYIDFRPRSDGPPYLADGARVPESDTRVPLRFDKLLTDAAAVADGINPEDVRTITRELGTAFGSKDVDLTLMGQQARRNLTLLQQLQPATLSLLRNGGVPLQTVTDHSADIRTFAAELDVLTAQVKASDPTLRTLLTKGNVVVPQVDSLLKDTSANLHQVVSSSLVTAALVSDRLPGLTHWLHWVPYQLIDMYESTRDGSGRVLLVPNPSPPCTYDTKETSPLDTTRTAARTDAHCKTVDPIVQQRGSQYAPRPN
ncbi:MAG: hypothetical protein JWQ70_885 [Aeromicrobium sp.]|nr:hypothetical protein [Aeromicrobium sp.]